MSQARDESAVIDVLPVLFEVVAVDALPAWLVALAAGVEVAVVDGLALGDRFAVRRRPDGRLVSGGTSRTVDIGSGRVVEVVERIAEGTLRLLADASVALRGSGADPAGDEGAARRWVHDHRDCVLGVAGAANAVGRSSSASSLATLLWDAADAAAFDSGFVRALTEVGVHAAVTGRAPETMAGLLRSAWVWFEGRGDLASAEEYALREWDLWRRAGRTTEAAWLLWWRADMFRRRGRGDLELRCYERLESLYGNDEDRAALARVRAGTAAALLSYDRADLAVDWARRAEHAVRALTDFPPVEQALIFEWSGRALWASGAIGAAKRRFSDALALLVDVDDDAADHVRRLLAHDHDRPLPPAVPDRYPAPAPRFSAPG